MRSAYRKMMARPGFRQQLYTMLQPGMNTSDAKAVVDETIARLDALVNVPLNGVAEVITRQDVADSEHVRLSAREANALMRAPGMGSLMAKRDTALLVLLLCTGLRAKEAASLEVDDLMHTLGGEPALLVRRGKGGKQRLVPWGELEWAVVVVRHWLAAANISEGPVFRGFHKAKAGETRKVRPDALTVRSIERVVAHYPIVRNGEFLALSPHDLRRTYARNLFEAGVDLVAIQQNLGHSSYDVTLRYIGALGSDLVLERGRAATIIRPSHKE